MSTARSRFDAKKYDDAETALAAVFKDDPTNAEASALKTKIETAKAEAERKRREEQAEKERQARISDNLATARRHFNAERYDDALTALKKVFDDAPGHSEATSSQAQIDKARESSFGEGQKAGDRQTREINGVEYAFRWCQAGEFLMGSPKSEEGRNDNETQHRVTLTKGVWLLETEVTQEMWESVTGENPSGFSGVLKLIPTAKRAPVGR